MVKLRAGIIGLGVGEQHIVGYDKHPQCEVVALCDCDERRLADARRKYPAMQHYSNADDLLAEPGIDVVSIASYDNHHYEQTRAAILAGKHVFVEKPLCLYPEEAQALRILLNDHPEVLLSSNLILRKVPRFVELRRLIADGELGELFHVEGDYNYGRLHKITEGWRGQLDFYSVVYGGAVHLIDLLLWLTGDRVIEVSAVGNAVASRGSQFQFDDLVVALLRFESGMVGKVSANYGCMVPHFHGLTIYGTKGTYINGVRDAQLYHSRDPDQPPRTITTKYPGVHKGDLAYDFVESIVSGRVPLVTMEDVFRVMSVCFAIEQARDRGGAVEVEYI